MTKPTPAVMRLRVSGITFQTQALWHAGGTPKQNHNCTKVQKTITEGAEAVFFCLWELLFSLEKHRQTENHVADKAELSRYFTVAACKSLMVYTDRAKTKQNKTKLNKNRSAGEAGQRERSGKGKGREEGLSGW